MKNVSSEFYKLNLENISNISKLILNQINHKTILFSGDLGSGKTTLIKALIKNLGGLDAVFSPSFSIINAYQIKGSNAYHIDCYRINSLEEALDIGIEEYFQPNNWVFIEWPQIIMPLLPEKVTEITLTYINEEERMLRIKY